MKTFASDARSVTGTAGRLAAVLVCAAALLCPGADALGAALTPGGAMVFAPTPSAVYDGDSPALEDGAIKVRPKNKDGVDLSENLDDYDTSVDQVIADPFEPWNRFWFAFNDIFYMHVAKPVYAAYEFVTPHQLRSGIKNFFHNLLFPVRFVNNILQFRFKEAGVEFGRFVINTTTSLGMANVAKGKKTIVPVDPSGEDFGQTLGRWGIGHGFYIVWPFLGPSSPRDTLGRIGDIFGEVDAYFTPWTLSWGVGLGFRFNDLDDLLPLYGDMRNAAVDPYIAMRQAYINYRYLQVNR
jgi:phospholipid-binding lipoprotein MlaA